MERIARSFRLVGQSYRLLMQDKELMALPLLSGIFSILVAATFFFGLGFDDRLTSVRRQELYLPVFLLYVVVYAIGIFFQAAVVAGAAERMRGGDPTIASALAAAGRRFAAILLWAVVAATVGTVLQAIRDRVALVGRIVVAIVGAAWSLATFFIVPVLVLEDLSVAESFRRSVRLFKETWGETFVGGASLGIAAAAAWATLVAVVGILAWMGLGLVALVAGLVGAIFLLVFFSALQGIYVASLYRFATGGPSGPGLDNDLLSQAFVAKTPR
jgi:hypothetical protein